MTISSMAALNWVVGAGEWHHEETGFKTTIVKLISRPTLVRLALGTIPGYVKLLDGSVLICSSTVLCVVFLRTA